LGFFLLKFFLLRLFEKSPKLKKPPNADRLMVAALAARGLNSGLGLGNGFSICGNDPSESGTTPSLPWKTLNAVSKLGPSSKIGPLAPLAGTGKLTDEKEKLVGSLMFLRNGHLSIPCWTTVSSKQLGSLRALRKESIWRVTRPPVRSDAQAAERDLLLLPAGLLGGAVASRVASTGAGKKRGRGEGVTQTRKGAKTKAIGRKG